MALPNLRCKISARYRERGEEGTDIAAIFASSRTSEEERHVSRITFYKLLVKHHLVGDKELNSSTAFVASCLVISMVAAQNGREIGGKTARGVVSLVRGGGHGKLV